MYKFNIYSTMFIEYIIPYNVISYIISIFKKVNSLVYETRHTHEFVVGGGRAVTEVFKC